MSMMDFQSALAGGAPPEGAPPPEMMGGAPPPEMGGMPPEAPPPPPEEGGAEEYGSSLEALDAAEDALHAFIQLDPDEADRSVAAKCLEQVIKLKAANQQSVQSGDMKSLQRALAGGTGY